MISGWECIMATTFLEMNSADELRGKTLEDPDFRIAEMTVKQWGVNRFLYDYVGKDWGWTNKTGWTEAQWREYAEAGGVRTWLGLKGASIVGYFELHEEGGDLEIVYFGITPEFIGKGYGGHLLSECVRVAWSLKPRRLWLHTCELDHHAALPNYVARGFKIYQVLPENI